MPTVGQNHSSHTLQNRNAIHVAAAYATVTNKVNAEDRSGEWKMLYSASPKSPISASGQNSHDDGCRRKSCWRMLLIALAWARTRGMFASMGVGATSKPVAVRPTSTIFP